MMLTQPDVPFCLDDITADWLTMALQKGGFLNSGKVVDLTHRIIGEETGFNGEVVILSPKYSDPEDNAPDSLVLKIPTALKNRITGQIMGLYEKEIRFYRDLKPELNVRTPHHYYSALDVADDPDVVLERLQGLNKMPIWLIGVLSVIARWAISRTPRRYVLLIEDLSGYRLGDQMAECSDDDVRKILRAMADLHAQFWGSEELESMSWIAPAAATSKIIQMMYLQSLAKFRSANQTRLSERQLSLIGWLADNGIALTEIQAEEQSTLLHGDFRLDNICFDDIKGEVLLLDWQVMTRGAAGMDLAYFLSATIPTETSDNRIRELVEYYRGELETHGVKISPERMQWQYEIGMLAMLHRILPTLYQDQLDLGSERGPRMMQQWVDRIFSKVEGIQFETILDRRPEIRGQFT